jgi:hypothetical protein
MSQIKIKEYNLNSLNYKFTNEVAKIILYTDDRNIIFGGYPRDSIIHDYYANKFYEEVKDLTFSEKRKKYDDETFMPDSYKARTLCAQDIDCYMPTEMMKNFDLNLLKNNLRIINKNAYDLKSYINIKNIPENLKLTQYTIGFNLNPILRSLFDTVPRVRVDVIHIEEVDFKLYRPPFANQLDFECNGLIMTGGTKQVMLSSHFMISNAFSSLEKLNSIINKLLKFEIDMVCFPYKTDRITKMLNKGMKIHNEYNLLFNIKTDEEEMCTICLGKIENNKNIKRTCCSAIYHLNCYNSMCTNNNFNHKCPACRIEM